MVGGGHENFYVRCLMHFQSIGNALDEPCSCPDLMHFGIMHFHLMHYYNFNCTLNSTDFSMNSPACACANAIDSLNSLNRQHGLHPRHNLHPLRRLPTSLVLPLLMFSWTRAILNLGCYLRVCRRFYRASVHNARSRYVVTQTQRTRWKLKPSGTRRTFGNTPA
jgi:hypothetical protein